MRIIKDHFKNPILRKIAPGRHIAGPRTSISMPRILVGKERYEAKNIGKLHVTLDTNVVIDALIAMKKIDRANDREKASRQIIKLLEQHKFLVCMNSWLKLEYENIIKKLVSKDEIIESHGVFVMKVIIDDSFFVRMSVAGSHISESFHDDHLFDGTIGHYLITSDNGDVNTEKVRSRQKNFNQIISPQEFIKQTSNIMQP